MFMPAIGSLSSLVSFTARTPTSDANIPNDLATSGKNIQTSASPSDHLMPAGTNSVQNVNNDSPSTIAPMFSAAVDSNRSAPLPAQSPTLSPTRSAMTAGLRGSSSGMPASIFPTKSAPTSAALVKIPPPSCANSAAKLAPNANPIAASSDSEGGNAMPG